MSHDVLQKRRTAVDAQKPPFIRLHGQKIVALLFWLTLLGCYQWYRWHYDVSAWQALAQIVELLRSNSLGPLLYIIIYTLRPLILFPATFLTVGGGLVFGPVWGIIYTIVGSNLSAMVAYFIGRFFGEAILDNSRTNPLIQRYTQRLRAKSFETVMIMRFILLPYDLVNYLCGVLRINWQAYLLATIIGSLPGTFAFVLAGASLKGDLSQGLPSLDPRVFAASVVLLLASLLISRYVKTKDHHSPIASSSKKVS